MTYTQKYLADYGILRSFNGTKFKLVSMNCYRQAGIEDEARKHTEKGKANEEKLSNNLSRARSRVFELAMCNPWSLFVTLTLDKDKYDRADLQKFVKDFGQFVRDYRKKHGTDVKYLLIPERHQDGSWHMHGFLSGLPVDHLTEFTTADHLPYRILNRLQAGKRVFTWTAYAQRFGFSVVELVENNEAASKYMTKYITKEAMTTITELNAHMFYASKGLQGSTVINQDLLARSIAEPDYTNDYVAVKWFDDCQTALAHFGEVSA